MFVTATQCVDNPCENGGTCVPVPEPADGEDDFRCHCVEGFYGPLCESSKCYNLTPWELPADWSK